MQSTHPRERVYEFRDIFSAADYVSRGRTGDPCRSSSQPVDRSIDCHRPCAKQPRSISGNHFASFDDYFCLAVSASLFWERCSRLDSDVYRDERSGRIRAIFVTYSKPRSFSCCLSKQTIYFYSVHLFSIRFGYALVSMRAEN